MKKIILTGGGSAGHVTPNIALLPALKKAGFEAYYIGSHNGIEKKLIEDCNIPYFSISSGKLRRYFDIKNFTDPFRIIKGFLDAKKVLKKINPDFIFSKGGFVTVPVVFAARHLKIPTIIHESDMTPGLANKLCIPSAYKVCCNFPETVSYLPKDKAVLTGSPIREELFSGNRLDGLVFCGFSTHKPVILVMGGSLGSLSINTAIRNALPELLNKYQVIHLCGKGHLDPQLNGIKGYVQFEYINEELSDLLHTADLIVSRAGANAVCEFLALRKPTILIPLPTTSSRGDQILNAKSFEKQGYSYLLTEEKMTRDSLNAAIDHVFKHKADYIHAMSNSKLNNSIDIIVDLINQACN